MPSTCVLCCVLVRSRKNEGLRDHHGISVVYIPDLIAALTAAADVFCDVVCGFLRRTT